ncbi:MAG: stage IV sporulation protein A [Oscillospiraceae bacterium]|nr:stage IV sporulation protein A [Oscillospiraceae bacterium]
MENIYRDISQRTNGDIYIGVVGPVRSGKSTFIKRFMETLVIPRIDNVYTKERARDELPQSGSGRTIMTAEPKFVPEEAVNISLGEKSAFNVRMIDCVGYMVEGAMGVTEDGNPRMVTTPWCDGEIPMTEAAEIGTQKVISEHSTIGLVVTTDGSITEIERENYVDAEERVIEELLGIGKPFIVLVNSVNPDGAQAKQVCESIADKYNVTCVPVNCMTLDEKNIRNIIKRVLYEFPLIKLDIRLPAWFESLPGEHKIKAEVYESILQGAESLKKIRDVAECVDVMSQCQHLSGVSVSEIELGSGSAVATAELPKKLFYDVLSEETGFSVTDDSDLVPLLRELSEINAEYRRVSDALEQVKETGYGIVMPSVGELKLEEPEIVKQGGQYGVRLRASAPSIHMMRADITTEVAPIVGSEKQSEELVVCMLKEFENTPEKIWETNIFGKSLYDLVNEGLHNKLYKMPHDAQMKIKETVERITNETCSGLICIII